MKEISGEPANRNCIICKNYGAIFEGAKSIADEMGRCLECKKITTRWITPIHSWIKQLSKEKVSE